MIAKKGIKKEKVKMIQRVKIPFGSKLIGKMLEKSNLPESQVRFAMKWGTAIYYIIMFLMFLKLTKVAYDKVGFERVVVSQLTILIFVIRSAMWRR